MRGLGQMAVTALGIGSLLVACGTPSSSAPTPAAIAPDGVVVVNRSDQPLTPVPGFIVPACAEVFYDASTVRVINIRIMDLEDWPTEDGEPPAPLRHLTMFPTNTHGRWFLLVTSTDAPRVFLPADAPDAQVAQNPALAPRPDVWPACEGRARLG